MTVKISHKISQEVTLQITFCCVCGGPIALEEDQYRRYLSSHEYFHCPRGHQQCFVGQSEAERLRVELTRAQELANSLQTQKGELARELQGLKKRVKAGVCPYCKRHFIQLERHMINKHADK